MLTSFSTLVSSHRVDITSAADVSTEYYFHLQNQSEWTGIAQYCD
jgi:hypothetical protein